MKSVSDFITPLSLKADNYSRTVYYDASCNLCYRFVQFILKHSKRGTFDFAPLQNARKENPNPINSSVIFKDYTKVYTRSDAVLHILRYLSWPLGWLYSLIIIPKFLRDGVYMFVAKNRYKWFGNCNCNMEKGR